jgi:hypothetical protein
MPELRFKFGEAFPAHDPIALWVMNLSIALGDLRIVGKYATRNEQPPHERIYFIRVFASHLREIVKLLVLDPRDREDVREFVNGLDTEAQDARRAVEQKLDARLESRGVDLLSELKRLRDDTFHYARDETSQERLRTAVAAASDEDDRYVVGAKEMRAEYADTAAEYRMHPWNHADLDEHGDLIRELHGAIIELNGHVATFIAHAEASYLFDHVPPGIVVVDRSS